VVGNVPARDVGRQHDLSATGRHEAPEAMRLAALPEDVDLHDLLSAQPPANPELRARWREFGLLPPEEGETS
jgi:hypothetical protein